MPATHTNALTERLKTALEARQTLLAQMEAEQTNAYRLFHGSDEGESGLTVDRYGDLLRIQTFHRPLTAAELSRSIAPSQLMDFVFRCAYSTPIS